MSIRILYITESCAGAKENDFCKNIYELTEKSNGSFRVKWIFPDFAKKQVSRSAVLPRESVIPQIEQIAKGSVPLLPAVSQKDDKEICSLQIMGIGAVSVALSWTGVELKGVPHLESYIDWICTECEAIA